MKTKSLILGAVATVFAIGGALASNMVIANYVQFAPSNCRAIQPVDCGVSGNLACKVEIGGVIYTPVYQSKNSSDPTLCAQPVTTQSSDAIKTEWK